MRLESGEFAKIASEREPKEYYLRRPSLHTSKTIRDLAGVVTDAFDPRAGVVDLANLSDNEVSQRGSSISVEKYTGVPFTVVNPYIGKRLYRAGRWAARKALTLPTDLARAAGASRETQNAIRDVSEAVWRTPAVRSTEEVKAHSERAKAEARRPESAALLTPAAAAAYREATYIEPHRNAMFRARYPDMAAAIFHPSYDRVLPSLPPEEPYSMKKREQLDKPFGGPAGTSPGAARARKMM